MTPYQLRLQELDQLIADAQEVLSRSSNVLLALKTERVNFIVANAERRRRNAGRVLPNLRLAELPPEASG